MKKYLVLLYLSFLSTILMAQVEKTTEIYKDILERDSLLFNVGFNTCDIIQFENIVSNDFEFYHDKGGAVKSKSDFLDDIKSGIFDLDYKAIRKLDRSKIEIYPLYTNGVLYGAIQNGIHRFYALEVGSELYLTSVAKFCHLWLLENDEWKLSNSLSYDHKAFEKPVLFKDQIVTEKWLKKMHIPALGIGFIDEGEIKQISVFGELEKGIKAPRNTMWNVASLTKPITALVALKLIDSGKLNLDELIYSYYVDPDISDDPRTKQLTVRLILSHQTGLPNNRDNNENGRLSFEFEPGTKYQYSGEAFDYLRKVIEIKCNTSIQELADELIFKPLKMENTNFIWSDDYESKFAKWHTEKGELYPTLKREIACGADDLLTTIEDYTLFINYVMNGAGLSDTLYKEMISEHVRLSDYKSWGLSWWIDKNINSDGDFAIVHGGDDIGVHTIAFILPKTKQGLVIFTNSDNGTEAYIEVLLSYLGQNGQGIIDVEMK